MAYRSGYYPITQLRRRRLGLIQLVFCTVAASAPLTVLGGGVTTTFAVTGSTGVPLSFLVLALTLALFAVGYAAMSRHVTNAGAFYSYLAQGLGRTSGVAGGFVALVSYNAIQIGLYGLFGTAMADLAAALGLRLSWWVWALLALAVVATLGVLRVGLNATVLAVLLVLECLAVVLYDIGAFGHPASGTISTAGLDPGQLLVPGVGAVLALGITAFIGCESAAVYAEECHDPQRTVGRATFLALGFTGVLYALSAWAMSVTVGPSELPAAATENGSGLVLGAIAEHWGTTIADLANVLFLTSVFAALLSFHNGVSRYLFALGRERVLPQALARVGARSGGPVAGSIVQTLTAVVVLVFFVAGGFDPILHLFTWLSGIAAVGVVALMAATSAAVIGYFRRHPGQASPWQRLIAPALAFVVLTALVGLLLTNFATLLGADPTSPLRWMLPLLVLLAAVAGLVWGLVLRATRPDGYARIGRGALAPVDEELPQLPALPRR